MTISITPEPRPGPAPVIRDPDSSFEMYDRIASVALLYGSTRLFVSEHNSAKRLLKELHRLGREGLHVRGMICSHGALSVASIRALNCYLTHYYGQLSRRQLSGQLHRFAWYALQRAVGARWVR